MWWKKTEKGSEYEDEVDGSAATDVLHVLIADGGLNDVNIVGESAGKADTSEDEDRIVTEVLLLWCYRKSMMFCRLFLLRVCFILPRRIWWPLIASHHLMVAIDYPAGFDCSRLHRTSTWIVVCFHIACSQHSSAGCGGPCLLRSDCW